MSKAHTLDPLALVETPRESKLARITRETRKELEAYQRDSGREGGLISKALAATILDVSHQRVCQLVESGCFSVFHHFDKEFVSIKEVKAFLLVERKAGRPWKRPSNLQLLKAALRDTLK